MESQAETAYTKRARYVTLDKTFGIYRAPITPHIFLKERDLALLPNEDSAVIACDLRESVGGSTPATVPLLLASYLRIKPGNPLRVRSMASTELYYVIKGSGVTRWEDGEIAWQEGDVMMLPGGFEQIHTAQSAANAVLWQVTNEPQLAFESAVPGPRDRGAIEPTHFPAAQVRSHLAAIRKTTQVDGSKSTAMLFSTDAMEPRGTSTPSLTLALNSVEPGDYQPPHLHNSVAVTLIIQQDACYSLVDGERIEWSQFATFITPARAVHSHHNDSKSLDSLFLIVQDGGLYYHCRTIGFANVPEQ